MLKFIILFLSVSAFSSNNQDSQNTPEVKYLYQLSEGASFVSKKDLLLPANSTSIRVNHDDQTRIYCDLGFTESSKSRILQKGSLVKVSKTSDSTWGPSLIMFDHAEIKNIKCVSRFSNDVFMGMVRLTEARNALSHSFEISDAEHEIIGVQNICQ